MDVRQTLDELIRARGDDYASVSRLLGRNAAYIQQFIHRGVPRRLHEDDRRKLAAYFGVDETQLGGPIGTKAMGPMRYLTPAKRELFVIPRLDVNATAGHGGLNEAEQVLSEMAFDPLWLRKMQVRPQGLSMIEVQGDSMAPTLSAGDETLVDRDDAADRLRDGIYVLRLDSGLIVKRMLRNPVTRSYVIHSDNTAYPAWDIASLESIDIIGRVVWVGRRLG